MEEREVVLEKVESRSVVEEVKFQGDDIVPRGPRVRLCCHWMRWGGWPGPRD